MIYDKNCNSIDTINIREEMDMLFYSEGATLGICPSIGFGICFDLGMQSLTVKKPAV